MRRGPLQFYSGPREKRLRLGSGLELRPDLRGERRQRRIEIAGRHALAYLRERVLNLHGRSALDRELTDRPPLSDPIGMLV